MSEDQQRAGPRFRVAEAGDRDAAVATLASAFESDPLWSRAFPDPQRRPSQYRVLWGLIVDNALPHRKVWMSEAAEAVAVWFPPGAAELSAADEARLPSSLAELVGPRSSELLELFARFDEAHPHEQPHYYLDLFGTHTSSRGHGIGMQLLRHTLSVIDETGAPCYLESTNPANNARYASVGFEAHGQLIGLPDGPAVTTMWRPGASASPIA